MLKIDSTYRKGKRERKVMYFTPAFVYYKTKTDIQKRVTRWSTRADFDKWMKGAELVPEKDKVTVLKYKNKVPTVIEYKGHKYNIQHPNHFRHREVRR